MQVKVHKKSLPQSAQVERALREASPETRCAAAVVASAATEHASQDDVRAALHSLGIDANDARQARFLREPPDSADPAARLRWLTSRIALVESVSALRDAGASGPLELSLSHCDGAAVAIAREARGGGIGVDIEPSDRAVSEAAIRRVSKKNELDLGLSPIAIWSAKEACFKATPENAGQVVANYELASPTRAILRPNGAEYALRVVEIELGRRFTVALAATGHA